MSDFPSARPAPPKAVLCPFCGTAQFSQDKCSSCLGVFSDRSRKQAQIDMGPWFVRNKESPFLPGYSYEKMRKLAETGVIRATSVVRGPSTQQFWLMAKFTPGLSHLVGHCFACPAKASPTDACCDACKVPFKEYPDRNALGLRYKTAEEVQKARQELLGGSAVHQAVKVPEKPAAPIDFPAFKPVMEEADPETPKPTLAPQQAIMDGEKPGEQPFVPGAGLLDDIFGGKQ